MMSPATVIPPKVPSRGYASLYREGKMAAHTTQRGKGKVARLTLRPKRATSDSGRSTVPRASSIFCEAIIEALIKERQDADRS